VPGQRGGGLRGQRLLLFGAGAEKTAGLVMGAQQGLDFPAQLGGPGAVAGDKLRARTGRQFNRPGKHGFGIGRRWIQHAGHLWRTVALRCDGLKPSLAERDCVKDQSQQGGQPADPTSCLNRLNENVAAAGFQPSRAPATRAGKMLK